MTFSSTKPPRPSSRLFSWLAQWTGHRRDSDQVDVSSSSATSSSNNTTPQTTPPPQPQQHHRTLLEQRRSHDTSTTTEPINVPRTRLSVALSVTDTATDTRYSSSVASSLAEHSQHQNQQQQQQAPAPSTDRLGSSYPDKRVSITSRPASVFSLPPPRLSRDDSATFCCKDDWPRADRMIIRQELVRLVMDGRLFCSPLDLSCNDKRILHVGCGNGGWCIDMANKYKHCWVLGIENWDNINTRKAMPRNFRFWKAHHDIMENLKQLPDNHFDLIYGRFLTFSYPPDYYRDIVKECWRICRPSGYLEMMELDMQIYGIPQVGPMTQMLNSQVIQLMESRSLDPFFARHLQDVFLMHELVEQMQQQHGDAYHAKYISLPLGVWGGRIGVMFRDDLHDLVESIQLSRRLDDDAEVDKEFMAILEKVDEELEANHAFMNLYHAYTQKL